MGRKSNFDKKIEELSQHEEVIMSFLKAVDLDRLIQLYIEAKTGIINYDTEQLSRPLIDMQTELFKLFLQTKLPEAFPKKKDKEE